MPRLVLEVQFAPVEPRRVELDGEHFVLGRDKASDIRVVDEIVSRSHLLLAYVDRRWLVQDLQSVNGVFLGDQRIRTAEFRAGDVIGVGEKGPRLHVLEAESDSGGEDLERTRYFRG